MPRPRAASGVLADRIAAALVHREPGWRLPRRSALARRYNVSMAEIDSAIGELARRSLIRRLPDGQLYRASPAEYLIPVEGIGGLATRLDPMGGEVTCQSRHVSQRDAPQDVTWALGVEGEAQVRIVRSVWTADGEPVAIATAYVPEPYADSIGEPARESSGDALLEAPGPGPSGIPLRATAADLEMAPPQPSVARSLGLVPGQSAVSVRIRFDDPVTGMPAGLTVVNLKPEHFRVVVHAGDAANDLSPGPPKSGHLPCAAGTLWSMPVERGLRTGPAPRRARYLIPKQLPRRGQVAAALVVVLIAAHLVFAQLTLILAVVFVGIGKASRWRMSWLAAPAVAGLAWALAIGPAAAGDGFAAGPRQIIGYLGAHGLLYLHGAFANSGGWLPRQFPVALIAAAAEAAAIGWLDWLHTDEWAVPPSRPGAVAAARRAVTARAIRGGGVVTRDGATLGLVPATGARAALSWGEVAGGVLFTGAAGRDLTATCFQVVHAALRLRKAVIVLDLTGDPAMGSALATACSAAEIPLQTFGTGGGSYEPFRDADPERRTELVLAALGAAPPGAGAARVEGRAETCLRAAFELMSAVPADVATPVLDDVLHLLSPMAAQARLRLAPADGPLASQLAERVQAVARMASAEPETLTAIVGQLADLRAGSDGGWLRPGGGGRPDIDLARVIRDRSAALFRPGSPATSRLVCADLLALGADLRRIEADGDAVVVLCGCEKLPAATIASLVGSGATAGLPVLATTTSAVAAAGLADAFAVLAIHRLTPGDARVAASTVSAAPTAPGAGIAPGAGAGAAPDAGAASEAPAVGAVPAVGAAPGSAAASLAVRTGIRMVPLAVAAARSGLPEAVPQPVVPHPVGSRSVGSRSAATSRIPWPGAASPDSPWAPAAGVFDLVPEPEVPVGTLLSLGTGQFTVAVQAPRRRLVPLAQAIPARLPRPADSGRSPELPPLARAAARARTVVVGVRAATARTRAATARMRAAARAKAATRAKAARAEGPP